SRLARIPAGAFDDIAARMICLRGSAQKSHVNEQAHPFKPVVDKQSLPYDDECCRVVAASLEARMNFRTASKISCVPKRRNVPRRTLFAAATILAIGYAVPAVSIAQTRKPQHKATPAVATKPAKVDCGGNIELRV